MVGLRRDILHTQELANITAKIFLAYLRNPDLLKQEAFLSQLEQNLQQMNEAVSASKSQQSELEEIVRGL